MKITEGYYAVLFHESESNTIGVRFPDHHGIVTYGRDWEEAETRAQEALSAALESDFERDTQLPAVHRPKVKQGEKLVFVRMNPEIRMAYLVRSWREETGLTQKQMAERLEISYQAYQRMERPGHSNLTVTTLERIAAALKGELIIDLRLPRMVPA